MFYTYTLHKHLKFFFLKNPKVKSQVYLSLDSVQIQIQILFYFINWRSFQQVYRVVYHNLKWKKAEKIQVLQRKDCYVKVSDVNLYVLTRNWLPHKLIVQHFWKEFVKYKTQKMKKMC